MFIRHISKHFKLGRDCVLKRMILVGMMCFLSVAALAQDWQTGTGDTEYDCELLAEVLDALESDDTAELAAIGTQTFVRTEGGTQLNVYEYMGLVAATVVKIPNNTLTTDILFLAANTACDPEASSSSTTSSSSASGSDRPTSPPAPAHGPSPT